MKSRKIVTALVLAAGVLAGRANATIFGTVKGIVHDPQHRPVAGVRLALRASDSQFTVTSASNQDGEFSFSAVPIGDYVLTASAPGFAELQRKVRVSSGSVVDLHLALNLSAVSQEVEVSAARQDQGPFTVSVQVRNNTPFIVATETTREEALLSSLISTHSVLGVYDGVFVSLLAPPDNLSELASSCKNVGTWPVLVGVEGQNDTLLSSPIILYDYPQIAPESAGDLFDGTEIDEILSLRIMTLTDDEKREMSQSDERARQMLERTETMPVEQLMKLHGVLRGLRSLNEELP